MNTDFKLIEKEEVASLKFPKEDVKLSDNERKELRLNLDRANTLGNIEHHKVKIYFIDNEGPKVVYTTIWDAGTQFILLKQNVFIPINRIVKLEI